MNDGDLARSLEALDQALEERHRASEPQLEHGSKTAEPDAVMRQLAINLQAFARSTYRVARSRRPAAADRDRAGPRTGGNRRPPRPGSSPRLHQDRGLCPAAARPDGRHSARPTLGSRGRPFDRRPPAPSPPGRRSRLGPAVRRPSRTDAPPRSRCPHEGLSRAWARRQPGTARSSADRSLSWILSSALRAFCTARGVRMTEAGGSRPARGLRTTGVGG